MEIPYCMQSIDQADTYAVLEALQSARNTQKSLVDSLEQKIYNYVGTADAVNCNTSTSRLFSTHNASCVGPGFVVWTSTKTFFATPNTVLLFRAYVDCINIDSEIFNLFM